MNADNEFGILAQYANAIYGSFLFLFREIASDRSWSIQSQKNHIHQSHHSSLRQRVHSLGGHLLHYDSRNQLERIGLLITRVHRSPWFLAYDPYIDAVILSIRGTKSICDVTTSLHNRSSC